MLSDSELYTLERRAQNAVNGYTADVNITCYVYGQDVRALVQDIRSLKEENRNLREKHNDHGTLQ